MRPAAWLAVLVLLLATVRPVLADSLRIATFAAPLSREGPGLLLRDLLGDEDAGLAAILAVIVTARPDVLVLTDIDHDAQGAALTALMDRLTAAGWPMPHAFARAPNSGLPTGLDLNRNGRLAEARDAMGYGRFPGQGGLAILSRVPIRADLAQDFSGLLWRDLPGATLPRTPDGPFWNDAVLATLRLSSTAHWAVPIAAPGGDVTLLVWAATPPVFDGPEDMNGLRARDELRLWQVLLDGGLGQAPQGRFVIAGLSNLDPADGDGDRAAMAAFLSDPRWQDPRPASAGGQAAADTDQAGDPALDTASWEGPGNLRVSYVLPSADLTVLGAGVFWPPPAAQGADLLGPDGQAAGPHRLVWVDVDSGG
jgi:hypothetical protein